jgi:peptide/nickel transport system ATP-binding protein
MNNTQQPIMEVRGLSKHFAVGSFYARKTIKAVEDISFKLYPGRVTALVGESGSERVRPRGCWRAV